jgi:hypothetical protein
MQYTCVPLEAQFNCKMTASRENYGEARKLHSQFGARNCGWHLFDSSTLPAAASVCLEDVPFLLPDFHCAHCDAVSCEGQSIPVREAVSGHALHILGMAFDDAAGLETVIVHYTDGAFEAVDVYFKDWYVLLANTVWDFDDKQKTECKIGIVGKHYSDGTERCLCVSTVSLTEYRGRKLASVELPPNPDLFVFALTIESRK